MNAFGDRAPEQTLWPGGDPAEDRYAAIKAAIDDSSGATERWMALLQDTVSLDASLGLRLWLRIYAEALLANDVDTCSRLVTESFSFGGQNSTWLSRFRAGTEAIKQERYRDSLEMLRGLLHAENATAAPLLGETDRALLSILVGRVLLYECSQGETTAVDLDHVRQQFEAARSWAPEDGRPYVALAEYCRIAGRPDEARRMIDEAAARSPHGPDVHLVRGLLSESEGLWDEAGDQYEKAITAVGKDADVAAISRALERLFAPVSGSVYVRLGRMLQERHPERAHRAVERAIQVGRTRAVRLQIENGEAHVQRTGFKLLGEILESISRRTDAAAAYYESGLRSVQSGDYKTAADLFARASSLDPGMADVYWFWADALRVLSANPPDALDDPIEEALRVLAVWDQGYAIGPPSSRFAWAYLTRGRVLASLADLQSDQAREHWWHASAHLEQSLILDPHQAPAWLELARCHRSLGNYAVAFQAVRTAALLGGESLEALYEQALIMAVGGGQAGGDALRRLRTAIGELEVQPEFHAAAESVTAGTELVEALLLYHQRRPAEAVPLLDRSVSRMPADLSLRNLRAHARRMAGDRDGAVQDFARIWEDSQGGGPAAPATDAQIRATAANELGHYAEAWETLTDLLDSDAGSAFDVRIALCCSALGLGRTAQADRYFKEALVHVRHHQDVQSALDDLASLEWRLSASGDRAVGEVISRFRELLIARDQALPAIDEPRAAVQELRHVLDVDRPEPGTSSWLGAHAGLARLNAEAGQLEHAASAYQAILETDAGRTPTRFPEARVALLRLASAEAQAGFAASESADGSRTRGHFRRSLQLRTSAGVMSAPLDLLNDVTGLIYSDEQRDTLESALQAVWADAASGADR